MNTLFKPFASSSSNSGGTGKNYLTTYNSNPGNGDIEAGTTAGFSLGTVGTLTNGLPTGSPTFGSGASGNLSIAAVTSGKLAGSYSLSYASSAATTQGNMVATDAFTIDIEDQAKVLTFSLKYSPTVSASNGNWSGTSSNSFGIAVYDVTNSVWLTSQGNFNFVQSTGVGICTGTCQTGPTTLSIRVCVYNANATAGAITVLMDDFAIGPQVAQGGYAGNDPVSYTPTFVGFGTVTGQVISFSRDGKYLKINYGFTAGTTTAVTASMSLPTGLTIDTAVISGIGDIGSGASSATPFTHNLITQTATSTSLVYFSSTAGSYASAALGSAWASSTIFSGSFRIPISGWSSNSVLSSDTDTRVISFAGVQTSQAVTANVTNVAFTTVIDRAGSWNGTQYTVAVSGDYWFGVYAVGSNTFSFQIYKNGSPGQILSSASSATLAGGGTALVIGCNAGDILLVRSTSSITVTSGNISIARVSGPSVISATESVNMRYFSSSTTITGSLATVVYTTKGWDSHNAYNSTTGIYTVPVSGRYQVNGSIAMTGTFVLNSILDLQVQQTGSATQISESKTYSGGAVTQMNNNVGDIFYALAGDTIKVQASNSGTLPVIAATTTQNWISLARVGN